MLATRSIPVCAHSLSRLLTSVSWPWGLVPAVPLDSNKAVTKAYEACTDPKKVNLGEGIYRDDDCRPYVLPSIRSAEKIIFETKPNHEYAPIDGIRSFVRAAADFAFSPEVYKEISPRLVSAQTLSGTGALRSAADLIHRFLPASTPVYVTDPTWVNHTHLFGAAGFRDIRAFRWYDRNTCLLDINGCLDDLNAAPGGSVVVLHASGHNPTGVDPTEEQWDEIVAVCAKKNLLALVDNAYQGFSSGDALRDGTSLRKFAKSGSPFLVSQSFAKNMGVYGERVGAVHVATGNEKEASNVASQLRAQLRGTYSTPPLYGARLVELVLTRPELREQWNLDVKGMAGRMNKMRNTLVSHLEKVSPLPWKHIARQVGMFSFTGLRKSETVDIKDRYHVFMNPSGRIAVSGITTRNVEYLADAIHNVTKNRKD